MVQVCTHLGDLHAIFDQLWPGESGSVEMGDVAHIELCVIFILAAPLQLLNSAALNKQMVIRATTQQNQQNEYAPSEDSDQPGHPPRLIRVFAVRMKKPWVLS